VITIHKAGPDRDSLRCVTIPHGATLATCPPPAAPGAAPGPHGGDMSRPAAAQAAATADALEAFLRRRPGVSGTRAGATPAALSPATPDGRVAVVADKSLAAGADRAGEGAYGPLPSPAVPALPTGDDAPPRSADAGGPGRGAPLRLAHPDWLHHQLLVTGSRRRSRRSRPRRPGPGSFPGSSTRRASPRTCFSGWWRPRDRSSAASAWPAPASSPASCATPRHGGTIWRWPGSATAGPARSTCTLLLPVPEKILRRGPDDAAALAWLWAHWGTTEALRHVTAAPAAVADRRRRTDVGESVVTVHFWSADWSPWRALAAIGEGFPGLRFDLQPSYDEAR
jgi:hypothetical protein